MSNSISLMSSSRFSFRELLFFLEQQYFLLHSQSLRNCEENIVAQELLLRLNHPQEKLLYPNNFFPKEETSFFFKKIDLWVLKQAKEILNNQGKIDRRIARAKNKQWKIAINFSENTINDRNFREEFERQIDSTFDCSNLEIEINERVRVNPLTVRNIKYLKSRGIQIVLDDYGNGNAEISKLEMLPVDKIKIDRSLTARCNETKTRIIIKHLVDLCDDLKIIVCAEGIETRQEFAIVRDLGCKQFQGYFWEKPSSLF